MAKHNKKRESALRVTEGVSDVPALNPGLKAIPRRKPLSVAHYVDGILAGNRSVLSQAITILESARPDHQNLARQIVDRCLPHTGESIRIGITGVPGVGKSTFIEAIGTTLTAKGHHLAVLAVDPSSTKTRGSILGDKTRMPLLATDTNAYIRPSPTTGSLGGVARATRETMYLCEAAGYNIIFVETVGVGQSEIAVHAMVDFFLLLVLAGAGDELQGIKRGIVEMADALVITKADGANVHRAKEARSEYRNALTLYPSEPSTWNPRVLTCSAMTGEGLAEVWETIDTYKTLTINNGFFKTRRQKQALEWMHQTINQNLRATFSNHPSVKAQLEHIEADVIEGNLSPITAAEQLLSLYRTETP